MLDNELFSSVTDDIYIRKYVINPQFTNGLRVFVYAESSPNTELVNGQYYYLDVYFSVDDYAVRDHLVCETFGSGPLDKRHMDGTMDYLVGQLVSEDTFPLDIKNYIKSQEISEDAANDEFLSGADNNQ